MVGTIELQLFLLPRHSKSRADWPFSATRFKNRNRSKWWWCVGSRSAGDGDDNSNSNGSTSTRLIRSIQGLQLKLIARLKELSNKLPAKVFSFLAGFYCSTAFASVIGQTGDWDVLSAALAVALVEAMYKYKPKRNFIVILNYCKAGLSLGLFLDSFKY
ncbi:uncharacterized protein ycf20-like [Salvia miltiorrhiza]|uniref:uncharacterized protein ycf20-like n=1 Tax=Salvia miltiorrhiza TaxID=226208 RepID=UPI0025AD6124|nr:uncharacterized protein ycf20-like [Salvia miltiorrhiza]XP_057806134.1 uncharacterized protein ycf20-like [Salvia miltiorrhiza]